MRISARLAISLVCGLMLAAADGPQRFEVPAEEWLRPRSGERVASLPAVRDAVKAWLEAGEGAELVILHAGGETGGLWAAELRDWLVALGVEPGAIERRPGGPTDAIVILVESSD